MIIVDHIATIFAAAPRKPYDKKANVRLRSQVYSKRCRSAYESEYARAYANTASDAGSGDRRETEGPANAALHLSPFTTGWLQPAAQRLQARL